MEMIIARHISHIWAAPLAGAGRARPAQRHAESSAPMGGSGCSLRVAPVLLLVLSVAPALAGRIFIPPLCGAGGWPGAAAAVA
jgi:hypothetical protein